MMNLSLINELLIDVYYTTFILVGYVGPPSAEFCRTSTNFPQLDDIRFINSWEVYDEYGLSQTTLQSKYKESLVFPTLPIQW